MKLLGYVNRLREVQEKHDFIEINNLSRLIRKNYQTGLKENKKIIFLFIRLFVCYFNLFSGNIVTRFNDVSDDIFIHSLVCLHVSAMLRLNEFIL